MGTDGGFLIGHTTALGAVGIGIPNACYVWFRNPGNTSWVAGIGFTAGSNLDYGGASTVTSHVFRCATSRTLTIGANQVEEVTGSAYRILVVPLEMPEIAAPTAPAADHLRAFARDVNGFTNLSTIVNGGQAESVCTSDGAMTGRVQTTNATVTTILTIPLDDNTTTKVFVELAGQSDGTNTGAAYERVAAYRRNDAGAPALIGAVATPFTAEDTAGWDITLTLSGNNLLIQVTGAAATTIDWVCRVHLHKAT